MSADAGRTVRRYYGFQFCFSLLFWLPVFYEFQKRIGLTDPEIFGIQSWYYLAFCFMEIPTGMVADQLGYRRCMRAGAAVSVVANLLPILAPDYQGFLLHFMGIALARSFISGASSAYLYNFLLATDDAEAYKQVEGSARAYGLVGKVVGWSFIGALMEWHLTLPYWLTVAAAACAVGFALSLPEVAAPPMEEGAGVRARLAGTYRALTGSPLLALAIVQGVAVFVLARICQVNLFQPILEDRGFAVASYGVVMSVMTAFEAVGSAHPGWLKRWMDDFAAVFLLTTTLAVTLVLIPMAGPSGVVALLALFAFCTGSCFPIQRQVLNDAVPDSRYRATILSVESIVDRAVNAGIAAAVGGYLVAGQLDIFLRGAACATVLLMALVYWARCRLRDSEGPSTGIGPGSSSAPGSEGGPETASGSNGRGGQVTDSAS